MERHRVLHPLDEEFLEAKNLITHHPRGRRTVNSSALTSDVYISEDSGHANDMELPENLISQQTLEYIGFTADMAKLKWDAWCELQTTIAGRQRAEPGDFQPGLMEFVCMGIKGSVDYDGDDDGSWRDIMDRWGISEHIQAMQFLPEVKRWRNLESATAWISMIVEQRYLELEYIRTLSEQRILHQTLSNTTGPSGVALPSSSTAATSHPGPFKVNPRIPPKLNDKGEMIPSVDVEVLMPGNKNEPGFISLYRGCVSSRLHELHQALEHGELHVGVFDSFETHRPNDFCRSDAAYWTTQKWTAVDYARAASKSTQVDEEVAAVVVQMLVPNAWLASIEITNLQYGDKWKKVVWACRKRLHPSDFPQDIRDFTKKKPLVTGQICGRDTRKVSSLSSWDQMDESYLMEIPKGHDEMEIASQHVFAGSKIKEDLVSVVPAAHIRILKAREWAA